MTENGDIFVSSSSLNSVSLKTPNSPGLDSTREQDFHSCFNSELSSLSSSVKNGENHSDIESVTEDMRERRIKDDIDAEIAKNTEIAIQQAEYSFTAANYCYDYL